MIYRGFGICGTCQGRFTITWRGGQRVMRKHGPRGASCDGSGAPPASGSITEAHVERERAQRRRREAPYRSRCKEATAYRDWLREEVKRVQAMLDSHEQFYSRQLADHARFTDENDRPSEPAEHQQGED